MSLHTHIPKLDLIMTGLNSRVILHSLPTLCWHMKSENRSIITHYCTLAYIWRKRRLVRDVIGRLADEPTDMRRTCDEVWAWCKGDESASKGFKSTSLASMGVQVLVL
jgi:hypothetical protein